MSDLNEGDVRQYQAGTVAARNTNVMAVRDNAGKLWISIEDFLRRNASWVLTHPRYFEIDRCPSAVIVSEGNEVLFAGADELGEILGIPLDRFVLAADPGAGPVASN